MAHVETSDPLHLVGARVVRHLPGGGRRQERAWLTRYDAKLDAYALLVPGTAPRLVSRKEVVQFVTNPSVDVLTEEDEAAPPPVEDRASRFAGVPMERRSGRRRRGAAGGRVGGRVVCFLPFADKYRVEYDDGSMEEVTEEAVVDNMIQQLKSRPQDQEVEIVDIDVVDSRSSKRARKDKQPPPEVEVVQPAQSRVSSRRAAAAVAREQVVPIEVVPIEAEPSPEEEAEDEMQVDLGDNDSFEPHQAENDYAPLEADGPEQQIDEHVSILELDDSVEELIPVDEDPQDQLAPGSAAETVAPSSPPPKSKMPFYIIEGLSHIPTEPLEKRSSAFEYLRQWLLNLLDRQEAGRKKNLQQYEVLRNSDIKDRDACRRFLDAGGLFVLHDLLKAFMEDNGTEGDEDLLFVLKVIAMVPSPSYKQVMETEIGPTIGRIAKGTLPEDRERPYPRSISHLAKWIKRKWIEVIKATPKEDKPKPRSKPSLNTARRSKPMPKRRAYPPVPSAIPRGPSLMLSGTPAQNRMPVESPPRNDPTPIPRRIIPPPPPQISKPPHPFVDHPLPPPPIASFSDSRSQRSDPFPSAQEPAATSYRPSPVSNQPPPQGEQPRVNRLKPDWMVRAEAQSLSRVTLQSDSTAERRHYQAALTQAQLPPVSNNNTQEKAKKKVSEQAPIAGGPTGVYGRKQKLKFRKQWSVQEFDRNEPPITVNRNSGHRPGDWTANPNDSFRRYPPAPFINRPPKPILRRESRYTSELETL